MVEFFRQARFERLRAFPYSLKESTRAGKMAGQIPPQIKRQRRDLAMAAQREVAARVAESFVGRTLKVLVEGHADARQLHRAHVRSWEHGLLRTNRTQSSKLETQ